MVCVILIEGLPGAPMLLRLLITLLLIGHGIGHVMGIMTGLGLVRRKGTSAHSSLLRRFVDDGLNRWIGTWLWMSALLGFLMAGAGLIAPLEQWRSLATSAAAVSLVALGLYWDAFFSRSSKIWALAVDFAILLVLGYAVWPTDAMLGL
jgi:hypothetical protein